MDAERWASMRSHHGRGRMLEPLAIIVTISKAHIFSHFNIYKMGIYLMNSDFLALCHVQLEVLMMSLIIDGILESVKYTIYTLLHES